MYRNNGVNDLQARVKRMAAMAARAAKIAVSTAGLLSRCQSEDVAAIGTCLGCDAKEAIVWLQRLRRLADVAGYETKEGGVP